MSSRNCNQENVNEFRPAHIGTLLRSLENRIEEGNFLAARDEAASFQILEIPKGEDFLSAVRLFKRLGLHKHALSLLKNREQIGFEAQLEKALILGELGSPQSALRIFEIMPVPEEKSNLASYLHHKANFCSILHRYEECHRYLTQRLDLFKEGEYQFQLSLINKLGTEAHLLETKFENQIESAECTLKAIQQFLCSTTLPPHLKLAAKYYQADCLRYLEEYEEAFSIIKNAREEFRHNERENLMVDLLFEELSLLAEKSQRVSVPIDRILNQNHILYWHIWMYVRGLQAINEGKPQFAKKYFYKILSSEKSPQFAKKYFYKILSSEKSPQLHQKVLRNLPDLEPFIEVKSNGFVNLNSKGLRKRRLLADDLPAFRLKGDSYQSLRSYPALLARLTLCLLKNFEFGALIPEVWEEIWESSYDGENSDNTFRQLVDRWRKSPLAKLGEIIICEQRVRLKVNPSVVFCLAIFQKTKETI